mmetsp:Transcript_10766/g.20061  ORF Transcript_10766/g.20061 Transcript_10766/m.20061 type:complete len:501 (+) Transcript_10766:81-1583(+)
MVNLSAALISVFSALGAFLFGLDIGYIASILECGPFKRDVAHLTDWNDPKSQIDGEVSGFIVGIFSIGCIMAALPPCSAYFLDTWGRKGSIFIGSLVFLVGAVLQAAAYSIRQFLVGRLIAGFSIGLLSTVVALYQSELAPSSMRGSLTSIYQLMVTFGILVAAFLDMVLVQQENGWRIAIAVQVIPAGALLVGMLCLPRSPRWLVQQGHIAEAREVLKSMRETDEEANQELEEIRTTVENSKLLGDPRWSELLHGRVGRLVAVGVSLQLLQQLVGMNAFMYFGPRIFSAAGLDPLLFQTINAGVNFVATFPALLLADRVGRKGLLVCGAVGMLVTCLALGGYGNAGGVTRSPTGDLTPTSGNGQVVVMLAVFIFVVNFAYSWGPIVWVYNAEIYPLKYRSKCIGCTTTANWVGNYIIAQFTPILLDKIGFFTFYVFGFFSFIGLILASWLPETKGVLLEHIDRLFDEKFGVAGLDLPMDADTGLMSRKRTDGSSRYGSA